MAADPDEIEYEYRKLRYEAYVKERDSLRSDSLEVSDRYDKAVLTLAGGALALSVTFLEKIAPHPIHWTFILLSAAWLCLIASLLLGLFALSTSQTVTNELIEVADEEYRQYLVTLTDHASVAQAARAPQPMEVIERWKRRTRHLNVWSQWLLTGGILLLCAFSVSNLLLSANNGIPNVEAKPLKVEITSMPSKPLNESKGSYIAPSSVLPPPPPPKVVITPTPTAAQTSAPTSPAAVPAHP